MSSAPVHVHVKICGITNLADAQVAAEAGADLLGFIFHPKSPRYIAPDAAAAIVHQLQNHDEDSSRPRTVGVFVNLPLQQVQRILAQTGLDYAQLHGDEPPAEVGGLHGRGFKALRPTTLAAALDQLDAYTILPAPDAPQILLDAYSPEAYGGTGHRADWQIAARLAAQLPRLLLAGGLTPDSVTDAIAAVRPWGVDVGSGVESSPGRKDHAKVRAFIAAVRSAA